MNDNDKKIETYPDPYDYIAVLMDCLKPLPNQFMKGFNANNEAKKAVGEGNE